MGGGGGGEKGGQNPGLRELMREWSRRPRAKEGEGSVHLENTFLRFRNSDNGFLE